MMLNRAMEKSEQRAPITTLVQLHNAQRANSLQLKAASKRLNNSLLLFKQSLSVGNIFLSAVSGWVGLLQRITTFRRGYRIIMNFLESLLHKYK